MGRGSHPDRRAGAGDGMSSEVVFDMSEFDFEQLAGQLEQLWRQALRALSMTKSS